MNPPVIEPGATPSTLSQHDLCLLAVPVVPRTARCADLEPSPWPTVFFVLFVVAFLALAVHRRERS